jgi:hypothetical protein
MATARTGVAAGAVFEDHWTTAWVCDVAIAPLHQPDQHGLKVAPRATHSTAPSRAWTSRPEAVPFWMGVSRRQPLRS